MGFIFSTDYVDQLRKRNCKRLTVTISLDDSEHFSCGGNCDGTEELSISYRDWLKVFGAIKHLGVLEYLEGCSNIGKHDRRRNFEVELGTASCEQKCGKSTLEQPKRFFRRTKKLR